MEEKEPGRVKNRRQEMKEYRIGNEMILLDTGAAEFVHSNRTTRECEHFYGRISSIEDRGDYLYIGYQPNDVGHNCRFGYFRLYKDKADRAVRWQVRMV